MAMARLERAELPGPAVPSAGPGKSRFKIDRSIGPSGEPRRRYRTVFISDFHLGTRGCNAALLIDFLDHVDCDTLFLVGDIIDG